MEQRTTLIGWIGVSPAFAGTVDVTRVGVGLAAPGLLVQRSVDLMRSQGVTVTTIRAVDHDIAPGVYPDMTEHGFEQDAWPAIQEKVMAANILVLASPIWLGEKSSVCTRVIDPQRGRVLIEEG